MIMCSSFLVGYARYDKSSVFSVNYYLVDMLFYLLLL